MGGRGELGVTGAGSMWEVGEEKAGSGILKVGELGEIGKKVIVQQLQNLG